jgi:hypothetical protein
MYRVKQINNKFQEDVFSNCTEFHAEDYKIEEARASAANRFDNGFDNKAQKDDRQSGGRQNPPRKTLNSDDVSTNSVLFIYFFI